MNDIQLMQKQMIDEGLELIDKITQYIKINNERLSKLDKGIITEVSKQPSKIDKDSTDKLHQSFETRLLQEMLSKESDSGKPLYKQERRTFPNTVNLY